jgi:hypothetical protein
MDPFTLATLLGSVASPIIGGIIGNVADNDDTIDQKEAQRKAIEAVTGIKIPSIDEQKIDLAEYQSAGNYTPENEQTFSQEDTSLKNVNVDPRLKAAARAAMEQYQDLGKNGFGAEEKAEMASLHNQVARDARGRDEAVLQNMAMRGMGGSGNELAARLMADQQATEMAADQSRKIAAMANARALDAIGRGGDLGLRMDSQEYGQQSELARARDQIANFNVRNRQDVEGRNVNTRNSGARYNLDRTQDIMNRNTDASHREEIHNKGLHQTQFNNEVTKTGMVAGAHRNEAADAAAAGAADRNMWNGIGQGVGQGAAAYGAYHTANQNKSRFAPQGSGYDTSEYEEDAKNATDYGAPEAYKTRRNLKNTPGY